MSLLRSWSAPGRALRPILGCDPRRGVRAAELEARIRECLHGMRRGAEVFIGLVLHELSVADIAQQLGMKPNAVYVVFHRARNACRVAVSSWPILTLPWERLHEREACLHDAYGPA